MTDAAIIPTLHKVDSYRYRGYIHPSGQLNKCPLLIAEADELNPVIGAVVDQLEAIPGSHGHVIDVEANPRWIAWHSSLDAISPSVASDTLYANGWDLVSRPVSDTDAVLFAGAYGRGIHGSYEVGVDDRGITKITAEDPQRGQVEITWYHYLPTLEEALKAIEEAFDELAASQTPMVELVVAVNRKEVHRSMADVDLVTDVMREVAKEQGFKWTPMETNTVMRTGYHRRRRQPKGRTALVEMGVWVFDETER